MKDRVPQGPSGSKGKISSALKWLAYMYGRVLNGDEVQVVGR